MSSLENGHFDSPGPEPRGLGSLGFDSLGFDPLSMAF
jgi:hypothetical protein